MKFYFLKQQKVKSRKFYLSLQMIIIHCFLATSCLDHALEVVNNEIIRLDSSMEKAGKYFSMKKYLIIVFFSH
jgi:hypothetical protein